MAGSWSMATFSGHPGEAASCFVSWIILLAYVICISQGFFTVTGSILKVLFHIGGFVSVRVLYCDLLPCC